MLRNIQVDSKNPLAEPVWRGARQVSDKRFRLLGLPGVAIQFGLIAEAGEWPERVRGVVAGPAVAVTDDTA
ncbi:hypothetical protein A5640_06200 [Mycobacterium asiaticum]|uniref:Uncharacterized protein n=1 Tax=Mycobacterium asiaticum TaxID=1790 RepID=A0A1A3KTV6_MYCAS|nr:hypothetical protein A5640_06200 [Mycobacterium asiaticum]